ncbi:MAG: DNA helicase [Hyphomicrobiales bacterium]
MRLTNPIYQQKRQAKLQARRDGIPLYKALNNVAKTQGFGNWSLLARQNACCEPAVTMLNHLDATDLVLLGARPGHGKTKMCLKLVVEAIKSGNHAAFYSLEYTDEEVREQISALDANIAVRDSALVLDTSDDICADYIIDQLQHAPENTIVVIDYLQVLDQNRRRPVVAAQISALKSFAKANGLIVILISQIDRSYDPAIKPLPDTSDVRLPNALDMSLFTKTIFMNSGAAKLETVDSR